MDVQEEMEEKVPVTVLTGFLGAGKTTFLRRIVSSSNESPTKQQKQLRVAILQNEVGVRTGADELLVEQSRRQADVGGSGTLEHIAEWMEFANGCACCTVKDDLLLAVEELAKTRKFDYIVIECSGMADPGALAASLWVDGELESGVYLDAVLAFVDLKHIEFHLDGQAQRPRAGEATGGQSEEEEEDGDGDGDGGGGGGGGGGAGAGDGDDSHKEKEGTAYATEAYRQIAFADRIVLNKTDLVAAQDVERVRARVHRINAAAPILAASHADVPLDSVLGIRAFDAAERRSSSTLGDAAGGAAAGEDPPVLHGCGHAHTVAGEECAYDAGSEEVGDEGRRRAEDAAAAGHSHDARVSTASVAVSGSVDLTELNAWLGSLVWDNDLQMDEFDRDDERDMVLYRYKGVISIAGDERKHVLQGVHGVFEVEPTDLLWGKDEARACTLVFIGIDVDSRMLQLSFERAVARQSNDDAELEQSDVPALRLTDEQIAAFERDGVVVIENVLSEAEVAETRVAFHAHLEQFCGVDHERALQGDEQSLQGLGGARIKSPLSAIFYPRWKLLRCNLHEKVWEAFSQLYARTFAVKAEGFDHPFPSFDPRRGLLLVDRVCYRLPDHIRKEGGLAPHLDRNPVDPYLERAERGMSRWRPIQGFISLVDHYGGSSGGLRCAKGFHREIDEYFAAERRAAAGAPTDGGEFYRLHEKRHHALCKRCQPIDAPAGSLVLWDNRIVHSTDPQCLLADTREVLYTAIAPAGVPINEAYAREQAAAIRANLAPPAFAERGGAGDNAAADKDWLESELTDLQARLLGLKPWE